MEIISKEMIKPSRPTPDHLRNLKLSGLDQTTPQFNVPLIFFYQNENLSRADMSRLLKQSLSSILTVYPQLAGRIQEYSRVDCNDAGVEFIEAQVHASLIEVIKEPRMEGLQLLLPVEPLGQTGDNAILSVKISFFDCGGVAIGVCFSHTITDCAPFAAFLNAWAATCRGETVVIQPGFDFGNYFPPIDLATPGVDTAVGISKDIMTKRLVFNKEKLAMLKQFGTSSEVKNPTKVEAVSAFIWRHFIETARAKTNTENISFLAFHNVNLRPRAIPPIPEHALGNCWRAACAVLSQTEDSFDLVSKLRSAIRKNNDDYIKKLQNGDYFSHFRTAVDFSKNGAEVCSFSSWCRFPFYEVDFGWGKPVWVSPTTFPYKNFVVLMDNPSGDGIEAWVNMSNHHDLEMLETHYDQLNSVKGDGCLNKGIVTKTSSEV